MIASTAFFICLQALIVTAQTPPGFTPSVTEHLQVTYGANTLTPAGKPVARAGTADLLARAKFRILTTSQTRPARQPLASQKIWFPKPRKAFLS
jgi:hypothetical protein